jgi:predicted regulator of Ras-like GTPase activity (Roadblock/LC7/MglB family)
MTFTEILTEATRNVEGIVAAGLVGVDGIGVETVSANGDLIDVESIEIELAGLVGNVNRAASALSAGAIRDVIVEAENQSYLISLIDKNYFLVLTLGPGANLGRARFEVKRVGQRLRDSI